MTPSSPTPRTPVLTVPLPLDEDRLRAVRQVRARRRRRRAKRVLTRA